MAFLVFLVSKAQAQEEGTLPKETFLHQIGVSHTQSFYDRKKRTTSLSAIEYGRRFANKNTIIGRINYADRNTNVQGVQFEAETYLIHGPKYYSFASLSVSSNRVFPSFKGAYSLTRNFDAGWEGELGYRYLRSEGFDVHSSIFGVGKYLGNSWLNFKGYIINDAGKWQQSYRFTSRYYLNDELDFLTLILSTGTSPDDRSRVFSDLKFGTFLSKAVALGYKKTFMKKYGVTIMTAWNSQKINDKDHLNQVDVNLSLYTRF